MGVSLAGSDEDLQKAWPDVLALSRRPPDNIRSARSNSTTVHPDREPCRAADLLVSVCQIRNVNFKPGLLLLAAHCQKRHRLLDKVLHDFVIESQTGQRNSPYLTRLNLNDDSLLLGENDLPARQPAAGSIDDNPQVRSVSRHGCPFPFALQCSETFINPTAPLIKFDFA